MSEIWLNTNWYSLAEIWTPVHESIGADTDKIFGPSWGLNSVQCHLLLVKCKTVKQKQFAYTFKLTLGQWPDNLQRAGIGVCIASSVTVGTTPHLCVTVRKHYPNLPKKECFSSNTLRTFIRKLGPHVGLWTCFAHTLFAINFALCWGYHYSLPDIVFRGIGLGLLLEVLHRKRN